MHKEITLTSKAERIQTRKQVSTNGKQTWQKQDADSHEGKKENTASKKKTEERNTIKDRDMAGVSRVGRERKEEDSGSQRLPPKDQSGSGNH